MSKSATQREWGKYTDVDKRKVARILDWLSKSGRSQSSLARQASVAQGTANDVLRGRYPTSPTRFLNAMEDAIKAFNDARHVTTPFVETSVYHLVEQVCDRARDYAHTDDVGVLFGVVGVGKTTALKEYARRNANAIYLRAFDQMTITVLLNRLVWMTDASLEQQSRFRAATNADKVDAVIRTLSSTDRMLLIDETTRMNRRCLETLRDIADDAQVGLVLAGREHLEPMVQDELGRFGEISSRVGFWPPVIRAITEEDCQKIVLAAYERNVKKEVVDMYWQCCAGSARALGKLIASVQRYCKKKGCDPTPEIVSDGWQRTMRPKRYRGWKS